MASNQNVVNRFRIAFVMRLANMSAREQAALYLSLKSQCQVAEMKHRKRFLEIQIEMVKSIGHYLHLKEFVDAVKELGDKDGDEGKE